MFRDTVELIKPVSRFQRAIHVRYDLGASEIIGQYIPTQSSSEAVASILRNTQAGGTQRAHVLHAAYGSGKSHLGVTLAALLDNEEGLRSSLDSFVYQLDFVNDMASKLAQSHLDSDKRLLPVVLSGNEGDFGTSIVRALVRALSESNIKGIELTTRFEAAIETIDRWAEEYPDVYQRFAARLAQPIVQFQSLLENHKNSAYEQFTLLYSELTAGATFNPFTEQSPELIYRDAAKQIAQYGYQGIVVIWDEFGRYLEARTSQAFGSEAALLQDFAETCNHSVDDEQLHLLLLTHKELQGYAAGMPQSYQQEWSRIEGRFQRHNISTDPNVAYRLIAAAIQHPDKNLVRQQLDDKRVGQLVDQAFELKLFGLLPKADIRELIYQTWPLHPLTVFALAHVSSRVAQNERTMFTFLTSEEPNALTGILKRRIGNNGAGIGLVETADLWPYFEDAVRADIGGAGAHKHWSGVIHALDKVTSDDEFGQRLMRSLGILTLCTQTTSLRPTSELLSWSLGVDGVNEHADVMTTLDYLRRRKVVIHRQIDGYWTFITGSDINFEAELQKVLEQVNPTPIQLRRLLESYLPPPHTLARRYNQEYAMTRFFTGLYRWPEELAEMPWDTLIDQLNTDGLVIYVLATNELEWQAAIESIKPFERVIHVLPRKEQQPLLSLRETLRELFALQEINDDPNLRNHEDRDRVQREISWLLEDVEGRLEHIVASLTDPRRDSSIWIKVKGNAAKGFDINSPGQATKIVSDICLRLFDKTPELNSEGLNRHNPTSQQRRGADAVITALFAREPSRTFGIEGSGPDVLILNSLLKRTGLLHREGDDEWVFGQPQEGAMADIWRLISDYFDECKEPTPIEPLIEQLTQPPFGLRRGVLPLLLAAVLRERLKVSTIWHGRNAAGAITGSKLVKMVEKPADYAIEIGEWNQTYAHLWDALLGQFGNYILENEWDNQPLEMMGNAMLRWLQALPAFGRDTRQLSPEALNFRNVIRKALKEPAKALFETLPSLLNLQNTASQDEVERRLDYLTQEITNAYLDLQRRLEVFVGQNFGMIGLNKGGLITLKSWLASISKSTERSIEEFKFGSLITQDFVDVILETPENDSQLWNKLSEAVIGVPLRDWSDETEKRFQERVLNARAEIERDLQELIEEDKAITFSIEMPEQGKQDFRFRSSDLSAQGQRILQNFKSTMQVAGRPLSIDERRKVGLAFLIHIMGDELDE